MESDDAMRRLLVLILVGLALVGGAGAARTAPRTEAQGRLMASNSAVPVHARATPATVHTGGLIRNIDTVRQTITISSTRAGGVSTIEVTPATIITLSLWAAGFADMAPGDHLTVSGQADPSHAALGPNPILAMRIRIGSPHFGGVVIAVAPAAGGGVALSVRTPHGHHVVRIDVPARATVLYGTLPVSGLDLHAGLTVAASGQRVDKFELVAATLRIKVRHQTVGGTVVGVAPGLYRLVDTYHGRRLVVHVTATTRYMLGGTPATAAAVQLGVHIRVHGYDALRADAAGVLTLIADHVTVLVHQRTVGGTVIGVAPGVYRLVDTYYGRRLSIHVTAATRYTRGGAPATAAAVQIGVHIRVHGVDARHNDQPGVLTLIADRVDVVVRTSHPRHFAVVGTVVGIAPGVLRLTSPVDGSHAVVHVTAHTQYTLGGRPTTVAVQVGMSIRAHVYNALGGPAGTGLALLEADRIDLLVQQLTVGGTVVSIARGVYHVVNNFAGVAYNIHVTAATRYTRGGRPATAAAVRVGVHVRAHGYDAVHSDGPNVTTLIADHVEVLVPAPHHKRPGKPHRTHAAPVRATTTAQAATPPAASTPSTPATAPSATPTGTPSPAATVL